MMMILLIIHRLLYARARLYQVKQGLNSLNIVAHNDERSLCVYEQFTYYFFTVEHTLPNIREKKNKKKMFQYGSPFI